ncbi:MAG: ACP S-malonyltransferase [Clostridia bacterium]|nr:ACP S-malonyltransferase [Clostridia bacterium]
MKGKIAVVFPGQGSQYPGMGRELTEKYPLAKQVFAEADSLKPSLSQLCFEGPEEELKKTVNTQPALLTVNMACFQVLRSRGIEPDFLAGHSLGEYCALVASGVLEFTEALKLVMLRSQLMEEAVPQGVGGMAAILGLSPEAVTELCLEAAAESWVEPANFNCPGQVVIAGYREGISRAMELAKNKGAKRVIPLNVSGPFHSRLMEPAGKALAQALEKVTLRLPKLPVVANVTAEPEDKPERIAFNLAMQVSRPVRWEESILFLYRQGVRTFIEVGPGKVLTGLIKKTVKEVTLLNVEDEESLQATVSKLEEVNRCS